MYDRSAVRPGDVAFDRFDRDCAADAFDVDEARAPFETQADPGRDGQLEIGTAGATISVDFQVEHLPARDEPDGRAAGVGRPQTDGVAVPRFDRDIAGAVVWALSQPDRVDVNEILIRPTSQSS